MSWLIKFLKETEKTNLMPMIFHQQFNTQIINKIRLKGKKRVLAVAV